MKKDCPPPTANGLGSCSVWSTIATTPAQHKLHCYKLNICAHSRVSKRVSTVYVYAWNQEAARRAVRALLRPEGYHYIRVNRIEVFFDV